MKAWITSTSVKRPGVKRCLQKAKINTGWQFCVYSVKVSVTVQLSGVWDFASFHESHLDFKNLRDPQLDLKHPQKSPYPRCFSCWSTSSTSCMQKLILLEPYALYDLRQWEDTPCRRFSKFQLLIIVKGSDLGSTCPKAVHLLDTAYWSWTFGAIAMSGTHSCKLTKIVFSFSKTAKNLIPASVINYKLVDITLPR